MRKIRLFLAAMLVAALQMPLAAQVLDGVEAPAGAVVYSLPSTTIALKVTAEHESYQAGPYAMYAQKYLGIQVRENSGDFYTIKSIEMVPYVEADPKVSAAINLQGSKAAPANFLSLSSQGLVVLSDGYAGKPAQWRFPSAVNAQEFLKGASSNIDNATATLYKTVMSAEGIEKVPVKQSQTVVKSLEKKAEETAEMIFIIQQRLMRMLTVHIHQKDCEFFQR